MTALVHDYTQLAATDWPEVSMPVRVARID